MKKYSFFITSLISLFLNNTHAMLHQLPATDKDMLRLAENYPAVGMISVHITRAPDGEACDFENKFTGTLISLPHCPDLEGRIILCSKHGFINENGYQGWEKGAENYKFIAGDEERRIKDFFPVEDLYLKSCLNWLGITFLDAVMVRDMGIAILESPIDTIEPMQLYFDSLNSFSQTTIVTRVGYGFHGRLDLGIVLPPDDKKRATQFLLKDLKNGREWFMNPKCEGAPLYYNLSYNVSTANEENLIQGRLYSGDSGGPVILHSEGKDYIIGINQAFAFKGKKIEATPSVFIELGWQLKNNKRQTEGLEKINWPDLQQWLERNDTEVPEAIEAVAVRNYQSAISQEYMEAIAGAKS